MHRIEIGVEYILFGLVGLVLIFLALLSGALAVWVLYASEHCNAWPDRLSFLMSGC